MKDGRTTKTPHSDKIEVPIVIVLKGEIQMDDQKQEVTEVRETNARDGSADVRRQAVTRSETVPRNVVGRRVVYYIGDALLALLVVRFLLQLFGAAQGNAFVDFVYALSGVFVWPFYGIFGEPSYGSSHFETSTLVAIVIYGLLMVGIARLFTIKTPSSEI